ncbi:MAG: hypothetical protein NDI61_09925 [Bdellovibrionaceae bacterium]|nr:hypothetical protein [Pseudobdellovibrionaceae bacterium]
MDQRTALQVERRLRFCGHGGRVSVLSIALVCALAGAHQTSASEAVAGSTGVDSEAIRCIEKFVAKYESIGGYTSRMLKAERLSDSRKTTQTIEIRARGDRWIQLKYLDRGKTGVRNNGMTVTFDGTESLKIEWGSSTGLGFLVNGPAQWMSGNSVSIFSSRVVDEEIFTVNRAGFGFLAAALKRHLPSLKASELGRLRVQPGTCQLEYRTQSDKFDSVEITGRDSVFQIEEKFGTLAYLIYRNHSDKFSKLSDVFKAQRATRVRVPREFASFDLVLDQKTDLPSRFVLYWKSDVVGDYQFSEIRTEPK